MSYLKTIYFTDEYSEKAYPQKLCDYLAEYYFYYFENDKKVFRGKLLDIGSGKGNHIIGFHRRNYTVSGLDKREECVDVLKQMNIPADIKQCDIEKDRFPFEDNTFDWIYSKSVLEHVRNIDNFMQETLRTLKPGGKAVLMTPAWESQYKFFWDDYTHVTAFTRKSLQNAMKINGFENVRCDFFLQLPLVWKHPILRLVTGIVSFVLPDSFKWKDREQSKARKWVRFSKEKMLLAVGEKSKT